MAATSGEHGGCVARIALTRAVRTGAEGFSAGASEGLCLRLFLRLCLDLRLLATTVHGAESTEGAVVVGGAGAEGEDAVEGVAGSSVLDVEAAVEIAEEAGDGAGDGSEEGTEATETAAGAILVSERAGEGDTERGEDEPRPGAGVASAETARGNWRRDSNHKYEEAEDEGRSDGDEEGERRRGEERGLGETETGEEARFESEKAETCSQISGLPMRMFEKNASTPFLRPGSEFPNSQFERLKGERSERKRLSERAIIMNTVQSNLQVKSTQRSTKHHVIFFNF